jgi:hypothetical protein
LQTPELNRYQSEQFLTMFVSKAALSYNANRSFAI